MNIELTYMDLKDRIRSGLNRIAEDFVEIGYNLKQIRDRKLYIEDGYDNINDFAREEYGLSQSNTSRFIAINEYYSIDGNSPKLLPNFEGYGSSKLSEMLSLSPEEMKLVSIRTTVAEIRTIKDAKREAQQGEYSDNYATSHNPETLENTQSEASLENEEKEIIPGGKKLIIEFFRDKARRHTLIKLEKILREGTDKGSITEAIAEVINPSGHLMFKKVANILIFETEIIKFSRFGAGGVKEITYMDFLHDIALVFDMTAEDPWVMFYGELEPKQESKPKPKQESKPVMAAVLKKNDETVHDYSNQEAEYHKETIVDDLELVENSENDITQPEETEEVEVVEADIVDTVKSSMAADDSECKYCMEKFPQNLVTENHYLAITHDGYIEIHPKSNPMDKSAERVKIKACPMCGKFFN